MSKGKLILYIVLSLVGSAVFYFVVMFVGGVIVNNRINNMLEYEYDDTYWYDNESITEEELYKEVDDVEIVDTTVFAEPHELESVAEQIQAAMIQFVDEEENTPMIEISETDGSDGINVVREHRGEVTVESNAPVDDNIVFDAVEIMPSFPGGDAALMNWLSQHISYPPLAAENGIQGTVVVQFVVKKDGSIGEVRVVRGKDPDLDKEAVRVVRAMPRFIPGRTNGQPVNVWFTLPIRFRLQQ